MQTHSKIGLLNQTSANRDDEELMSSPREQIMDYYYLKYQYDHGFVIGDNKLNRNVEVMIGKETLYCSFHDTRKEERGCEHITYIKMINNIQN